MLDAEICAHLQYLRMRGLSERTIYNRQRALARMAGAIGSPLAAATAADLTAWHASLTGLDRGTISAYASNAREFYAWCHAEGVIADNPAARLPAPRPPRRLPRPISEADLMTALDCAPRRIRLWLVLAAWCGLRAHEIALLRVGCIQLTADPPLLLATGKGGKERIVPLAPFVAGEVCAAGLPAAGYAFRRHDGRRGPNAPGLVSKLCNEHLHACGIAASLHQLRHRFGTQAYRTRRDLRMTQELMGHASPETTAGYAAWDQAGAAAALARMPAPRRLRRAV
jgi:integrase/recombinase XerC